MLKNFIKLDFMTAMAWINIQSMATMLGIAILLGVVMQNAITTVIIASTSLFNIANAPFRGEQVNMNALYVLLNVNRKNVVRGRYLYTFAAYILCFAVLFLIIALGFLAESIFDIQLNTTFALSFFIVFAVMRVISRCMQLPVQFKRSTADRISIIEQAPQIITLLGSFFLSRFMIQGDRLDTIVRIMSDPVLVRMLIIGFILFILLLIYLSYRLACVFYQKREF